MIKNILYSLFLHFLLLLLVYANFNLKNINTNKSSEISVSLISMSGNEEASKNKAAEDALTEKTKEVQKEIPKEEASKAAESLKESSKNKVASKPKRMVKARPSKSVAKPLPSPSPQAVKEVEKPQDKPQESGKEKRDEINNQHVEDKKTAEPRKEQDVGSQKVANEKKDSDSKDDVEKASQASQAQDLENIDLSAREKFNIQSQLKRCYSRAISETNYKNKVRIMIQVSISEDGVIDSDLDDVVDMERYNNPKEVAYKIAVDNARRAIDLCSPIRNLPTEKYEIWKEVILEFGDDS